MGIVGRATSFLLLYVVLALQEGASKNPWRVIALLSFLYEMAVPKTDVLILAFWEHATLINYTSHSFICFNHFASLIITMCVFMCLHVCVIIISVFLKSFLSLSSFIELELDHFIFDVSNFLLGKSKS